MERLTPESLAFLLERAGLKPPEGDMERLRPLIEKYMESLKVLHSINLGDEESALIFRPEWELD